MARDDNDTLREQGRDALDPTADLEPATPAAAPNAPPPPPKLPEPPRAFAVPRRYTLEDLRADRTRQLVSLAVLPEGHGWGPKLDSTLGGGLAPGEIIGIGAAGAGAGKTAFTLQIADGLAMRTDALLRSGRPGPLTPVILLSEMPGPALAWRTLARLVGVPGAVFRSGLAAESWAGWTPKDVDAAYAKAAELLELGATVARMMEFQHTARPERRGGLMLEELRSFVSHVKQSLARETGREVWPVVVIDPLQRWQDPSASEVEALNVLAETVDQYADADGWIVLLTSDTNKPSASANAKAANGDRDAEPDAAALFRGSYKLFHACDAILVLRAAPFDPEATTRTVAVEVAKNRHGPAGRRVEGFTWHTARGLFSAPERITYPAAEERPAETTRSATRRVVDDPGTLRKEHF